MSEVLKIHSTVCEFLRTVDTDLIGFPLDVIVPRCGNFLLLLQPIMHKQQLCDLTKRRASVMLNASI